MFLNMASKSVRKLCGVQKHQNAVGLVPVSPVPTIQPKKYNMAGKVISERYERDPDPETISFRE